MSLDRSTLANALAVAATLIALGSAWHSIGHVRTVMGAERRDDAALSTDRRSQMPVTTCTISGDIFDFFRRYLAKGDRVYFQVMPSGFSHELDLPRRSPALGRFYFLPAVQTENLADATVVVSYFADPSLLHVKFLTQVRAGLQPLFVSRISAP